MLTWWDFTAYVLFNDPELFQKYLISSSDSWWDSEVVLSYEATMREQRNMTYAPTLVCIAIFQDYTLIINIS